MKNKSKISTSIIAGIMILILLFFSFAMSFIFGIGVLNILGFKYTSLKAVMLFFVIYTVVSFIIEAITRGFMGALKAIGNLGEVPFNIIKFIICVGFDIVLISIIESLISGITISDKTIILFSIIFYIIELFLEKKLPEDKE